MGVSSEEALKREAENIDVLDEIEDYQQLAYHLTRLVDRHLILLSFDKAADYAYHLLKHENSHVRSTFGRAARRLVARVDRARARGLYHGTAVRVCNHSEQLDDKVGHVLGRPGSTTSDFQQWNARCERWPHRDAYEVKVGSDVHRIPWKNLCLAKIVVQMSLCDRRDGLVGVEGTLLSGAQCAHFFVDSVQPRASWRLVERTAQAMGQHASNIQCAMPDGSVLELAVDCKRGARDART